MIQVKSIENTQLKDFWEQYTIDKFMYGEGLQAPRHSSNHEVAVYNSFLKDQNESGFFIPQPIQLVKCIGSNISAEYRFETNGERFFVLDGGHTITALYKGFSEGKFKKDTFLTVYFYESDSIADVASKFSQINQGRKTFKLGTKMAVKNELNLPGYMKIKSIADEVTLPRDITFAACTGLVGSDLQKIQNNFNSDAFLQDPVYYELCIKALLELHKPFVKNNTHNTKFTSIAQGFIKVFYQYDEDVMNAHRFSMAKIISFLNSEKNFKKLLQKMNYKQKLKFIKKEFFTVSKKNKPFIDSNEE